MSLYGLAALACVVLICTLSRDNGQRLLALPYHIRWGMKTPVGCMRLARQSAMWLWEIRSLFIHLSPVDCAGLAGRVTICTVSTRHFQVSPSMAVWLTS